MPGPSFVEQRRLALHQLDGTGYGRLARRQRLREREIVVRVVGAIRAQRVEQREMPAPGNDLVLARIDLAVETRAFRTQSAIHKRLGRIQIEAVDATDDVLAILRGLDRPDSRSSSLSGSSTPARWPFQEFELHVRRQITRKPEAQIIVHRSGLGGIDQCGVSTRMRVGTPRVSTM